MNINLIDNVEFAGSGVDLYLMSADYNGVQMTDEELDDVQYDTEAFEYLISKFLQ